MLFSIAGGSPARTVSRSTSAVELEWLHVENDQHLHLGFVQLKRDKERVLFLLRPLVVRSVLNRF